MAHKGKTVIVTGGAGGLGRAIAEHFISQEANVVICDINKQLLADFHEKVVSANTDRTLAVECDITSEEALDSLFSQVEEKFGKLDYCINSAGIMDSFHPAGSLQKPEWDRVIAVNLTAPMLVTQRAVNSFLKSETKGSIVNIASVASFKGFASGAAYTASKHGLIGLTRNTAAFYRSKGIRCNAIQAGAMETNISAGMAKGYNAEGLELMGKVFGTWEGAYADIKKMGKLVAYLCSEDAEMINGTMITADGGLTALH